MNLEEVLAHFGFNFSLQTFQKVHWYNHVASVPDVAVLVVCVRHETFPVHASVYGLADTDGYGRIRIDFVYGSL